MEHPRAPTLAQHAVALLTVSTVLHPLAILAVGLRFLARRKTASVKIDDYLALLALVFGTGLYVSGILICTIGFAGFHAAVLEGHQIERFLLVSRPIPHPRLSTATDTDSHHVGRRALTLPS
jgi:hypothetical protein